MTLGSKVSDSKVTERQEIIKVLNQLQGGEPFDFQFDVVGNERLKCKLVGIHETNFLVFAIPHNAQKGVDNFITNNRSCILRTIIESNSGICIGFKSAITGVIKKPYPLFFVNYPKTIERFSLRNEIRLPTHAPASIMTHELESNESNATYHGTIIDLSTTGCRFKLPWPKSSKAFELKTIFVKITFPSKPEAPLTVKGEVKAKTRYDDEHLSLGIKLEDTSELQKLFSRLGIND